MSSPRWTRTKPFLSLLLWTHQRSPRRRRARALLFRRIFSLPVAEWNALTKEELKQRLLAAEVTEAQATKLVNELSAKDLLLSSRRESFLTELQQGGFAFQTALRVKNAMPILKGAVASCASLSSHAPLVANAGAPAGLGTPCLY